MNPAEAVPSTSEPLEEMNLITKQFLALYEDVLDNPTTQTAAVYKYGATSMSTYPEDSKVSF